MKLLYRISIFGGLILGSVTSSQAQIFKKIKDKVEKEAEKAIDKKINKNSENRGIIDSGSSNSNRIQIEENSAFIAGDSLLYTTDFDDLATGSMPPQWKTTGSGSIVKISRFPGKWLNMSERTSYKLKRTISYPDRFTVEFDLIVAADKVDDLSSLYFGFSKDNSLSRWISSNDNIWYTALKYMNNNDFVVSSRVRDLYRSGNFDLAIYANQKMHVAIAVDGDRVQVYLDDKKIADSELFRGQKFKHFFISSPLQSDNGASVLFGNFRINTY